MFSPSSFLMLSILDDIAAGWVGVTRGSQWTAIGSISNHHPISCPLKAQETLKVTKNGWRKNEEREEEIIPGRVWWSWAIHRRRDLLQDLQPTPSYRSPFQPHFSWASGLCLLTLALKLSHGFCHRLLSVAQMTTFSWENSFFTA